jgi:DNA-binding NarL/FixJ family response regulator
MIRVLLVDDHELVRTGFRLILQKQADIEIVGEAANGEDAITMARRLAPDVVLMDVQLPGISGLEATERIVRATPAVKVIVVTMREDQPFPRRLLEAGALGYLTKACPAEELVGAVRDVARGRRYLSSDIARAMALDSLAPDRNEAPFAALSARELEVAMQLASGASMQSIAAHLHLSAKTVATYKYRLYDKLGIGNEVELAHLAARHGLVTRAV